jgi:hypothetical protein
MRKSNLWSHKPAGWTPQRERKRRKVAAAKLAEIIAAEERGERPTVRLLAVERFVQEYGPTELWPFGPTPQAVYDAEKTKYIGEDRDLEPIPGASPTADQGPTVGSPEAPEPV